MVLEMGGVPRDLLCRVRVLVQPLHRNEMVEIDHLNDAIHRQIFSGVPECGSKKISQRSLIVRERAILSNHAMRDVIAASREFAHAIYQRL